MLRYIFASQNDYLKSWVDIIHAVLGFLITSPVVWVKRTVRMLFNPMCIFFAFVIFFFLSFSFSDFSEWCWSTSQSHLLPTFKCGGTFSSDIWNWITIATYVVINTTAWKIFTKVKINILTHSSWTKRENNKLNKKWNWKPNKQTHELINSCINCHKCILTDFKSA